MITYAYFLIASHTLSKPDYGQITVLWSAVFITISTLYRPVEQLLSRHISERLEQAASRSASRCGSPRRSSSASALIFAVVALALRGPIQDGLLEGNETLYWVFFGAVLFYAASYFARGFLAGEQPLRPLHGADPLRVGLPHLVRRPRRGRPAQRPVGVAIGIVAAPCLSLLVVPLAFARRAKKAATRGPPDAPDAKRRTTPARTSRCATAAASPRRCW